MRFPFAVRRLASIALRPIRVRIRQGPNAGRQWSLAAAGRHRRGTFEEERVEAIQAMISAGDCVWEFGAHHGYVTLLASMVVGREGLVRAFEPSSYNCALLERHVRWNACENTLTIRTALSDRDGVANFGGRGSSQTFQLGGGTELVRTASIDTLLSEGLRPPDVMKIDIEGAEADVLEQMRQLSLETRLIVSIHSLANYERVARALNDRGFTLLESKDMKRLVRSGTWGNSDPDVVAVGPSHTAMLRRLRTLEYFGG